MVDHLTNLEYTTPEIDIEVKNMVIEQVSGLGADAIANPKKYKGFMGVSILHRFFAPKRMLDFFNWGSQLFEEFSVLLMDDPDKYNFMIFNNLSEKNALEKARTISLEKKSSYDKIISKLQLNNVRIVQFCDFEREPEYQRIKDDVHKHFKLNREFRANLTQLMDSGVGSKIEGFCHEKKMGAAEISGVRDILVNYIIEELASILYFTEFIAPIEVDPTVEFTTKKDLYEGKFTDAASELNITQRGHIYTHPEGITKSSY